MNTTVEALKKLYIKMGGDIADVAEVTLIPDMIAAIEEVYSGGGGGGSEIAMSVYHLKYNNYTAGELKGANLQGSANIELIGGEEFTGIYEDVISCDIRLMQLVPGTPLVAEDAQVMGIDFVGGLQPNPSTGVMHVIVIANQNASNMNKHNIGLCAVIYWKK